MKYLGLILLNLSSIAAGISFVLNMKRKCTVAKELIEMCDFMEIELGYCVNNSKDIIKHLSNEPSLSHLNFLKKIDFERINIRTEIDSVPNERLNTLFRNLGKIDVQAMLNLVSSFKVYMLDISKKYDEYYQTHAKLYTAFGFFGGIVLSLVII